MSLSKVLQTSSWLLWAFRNTSAANFPYKSTSIWCTYTPFSFFSSRTCYWYSSYKRWWSRAHCVCDSCRLLEFLCILFTVGCLFFFPAWLYSVIYLCSPRFVIPPPPLCILCSLITPVYRKGIWKYVLVHKALHTLNYWFNLIEDDLSKTNDIDWLKDQRLIFFKHVQAHLLMKKDWNL